MKKRFKSSAFPLLPNWRVALLIGAITTISSVPVSAAENVERGKTLFKRCAICHQIGDGAKNKAGPVLTAVVGRLAASYEGYFYGKSIKAAGAKGLIWSKDQIFEYLPNPTKYLRSFLDMPRAKSKMRFKLKNEQDRSDIISYLATFSKQQKSQIELPVSEVGDTASTGRLCVTNTTLERLIFSVDANDAEMLTRPLDKNQILCVQTLHKSGVVRVFASLDAIEGCSKIVSTGIVHQMKSFGRFDNCEWLP